METFIIKPGQLTLADLRRVYQQSLLIALDESAIPRIQSSVACVNEIIADSSKVAYGINTGFGLLASKRIAAEDLQKLQHSLVLSHACGVGETIEDSLCRLILLLKINSLARGFSGVRLEVIEALIKLFNGQVYPCIPAKGSVGASGDLAPLAHMSLVLIGEGSARYQGQVITGKEALAKVGLVPLTLAAKEGLALLNGTQVSTAYALKGLLTTEDLLATAIGCGALTVEAVLASRKPFDARIHEVRGQKGQMVVAACFRHLLGETSDVAVSHRKCGKVQDPYSIRCQPQVMGACLTQLQQAAEVLWLEANAVSDNPLIFAEAGDIISGGNFHAEPVAMAADNIALALAEIAALAERRIALLMDTSMSSLPPFLVEEAGVNSGFMIAQVTAAALASQTKLLAMPCSVDSLPTSANQEDHVSMAANAGRRLWEMADNLRHILAIEWLAACQGLDFRCGLATSPLLEELRLVLRNKVAFYDKDRFFAPDIAQACELIETGVFAHYLLPHVFVSYS